MARPDADLNRVPKNGIIAEDVKCGSVREQESYASGRGWRCTVGKNRVETGMRRLTGLTVAAFLIIVASAAGAGVIRVPSDFGTIQLAVSSASEGDTVLVEPGTYSGPGNHDIDFGGVNLALVSEAGPAATTIDCQNVGRGFYFHSGETVASVVEGFRITNGGTQRGGGIRCEAASGVTVRNCTFDGNVASSGGGGINCAEGSDLVVENVTFEANTALRGGGIMASGGSTLSLDDVRFVQNTASLSAGMRCEGAPATLNNVVFESNLAYETVGGFAAFDAAYSLTDVVFRGNSGTVCGGFSGANVTATIANCTFALNAATQGTALNCEAGSDFDVVNSVISYQLAGETVYCDPAASLSITRSCIYGNAGGDSLCGDNTDNIFVDPLFCDMWSGDLRLYASSPCLPDNNAWSELLGANGETCSGPSPVEHRTWGGIKAMYRP